MTDAERIAARAAERERRKAMSPEERMAALQADTARWRAEKEEACQRNLQAAGDSARGIRMQSNERPDVTLLITPDATETGSWRVTRYDQHGASGHFVFKTREAAIRAASGDSFSAHINGPHYYSVGEFSVVKTDSPSQRMVEALLPIAPGKRGFIGGYDGYGKLVIQSVEDAVATDHSEFGIRKFRFRYAMAAPDTILWSSADQDEREEEWDEVIDRVAHRLEKSTGVKITRHRYYPKDYQIWRSRVGEFSESFLAEAQKNGWIDPSGIWYPLTGMSDNHEFAARRHLEEMNVPFRTDAAPNSDPRHASEELYRRGWKRVVPYSSDALMANGPAPLNRKQLGSLVDMALFAEMEQVWDDTHKDLRCVWSLGESAESDYAEYMEISQRWRELIQAGQLESPEVMELWKRNEEIKNRHGGMPPPPPGGAKQVIENFTDWYLPRLGSQSKGFPRRFWLGPAGEVVDAWESGHSYTATDILKKMGKTGGFTELSRMGWLRGVISFSTDGDVYIGYGEPGTMKMTREQRNKLEDVAAEQKVKVIDDSNDRERVLFDFSEPRQESLARSLIEIHEET